MVDYYCFELSQWSAGINQESLLVQEKKEDVPISSCVEIHYFLKLLELPKNSCDKFPVKLNFTKKKKKSQQFIYLFSSDSALQFLS